MIIIFTLLLCLHLSISAPVQDSSGRALKEKGCHYLSNHYNNGERIDTNEPCLNCTCLNNMLMCYLRICPFMKPIGKECIVERNKEDCCPKIWCPEVVEEEKNCGDSDQSIDERQGGCYLNGRYFSEGSRLPVDPLKPCEVCYCIRNSSTCVVQQCELHVEGCSPIYTEGQCCPCRYNCTYEESTTAPPGVTLQELAGGCLLKDGTIVDDGAAINGSSNPCEHCYCMRNELVCAIEECQVPGPKCQPLEPKPGQCCPDRYKCPTVNPSETSSKTTPDSSVAVSTVFSVTEGKIVDEKISSTPNPKTTEVIEMKDYHTTSSQEEVSSSSAHSEEDVSDYTPTITDDISAESYADKSKYSSSERKKYGIKGPPERLSAHEKDISPESALKKHEKTSQTGEVIYQEFNNLNESLHSSLSLQNSTASVRMPSNRFEVKTAQSKKTYGQSVPFAKHEERAELAPSSSAPFPLFPSDSHDPSIHHKSSILKGGTHKSSESEEKVLESKQTGTKVVSKGKDSVGKTDSKYSLRWPLGQVPGEHQGPVRNFTSHSSKKRPAVLPIPGEGVCRIGGIVYQNGQPFATSNPCKTDCYCINSVILCNEVICEQRTEVPDHCQEIVDPTKCCPQYVCDTETTKEDAGTQSTEHESPSSQHTTSSFQTQTTQKASEFHGLQEESSMPIDKVSETLFPDASDQLLTETPKTKSTSDPSNEIVSSDAFGEISFFVDTTVTERQFSTDDIPVTTKATDKTPSDDETTNSQSAMHSETSHEEIISEKETFSFIQSTTLNYDAFSTKKPEEETSSVQTSSNPAIPIFDTTSFSKPSGTTDIELKGLVSSESPYKIPESENVEGPGQKDKLPSDIVYPAATALDDFAESSTKKLAGAISENLLNDGLETSTSRDGITITHSTPETAKHELDEKPILEIRATTTVQGMGTEFSEAFSTASTSYTKENESTFPSVNPLKGTAEEKYFSTATSETTLSTEKELQELDHDTQETPELLADTNGSFESDNETFTHMLIHLNEEQTENDLQEVTDASPSIALVSEKNTEYETSPYTEKSSLVVVQFENTGNNLDAAESTFSQVHPSETSLQTEKSTLIESTPKNIHSEPLNKVEKLEEIHFSTIANLNNDILSEFSNDEKIIHNKNLTENIDFENIPKEDSEVSEELSFSSKMPVITETLETFSPNSSTFEHFSNSEKLQYTTIASAPQNLTHSSSVITSQDFDKNENILTTRTNILTDAPGDESTVLSSTSKSYSTVTMLTNKDDGVKIESTTQFETHETTFLPNKLTELSGETSTKHFEYDYDKLHDSTESFAIEENVTAENTASEIKITRKAQQSTTGAVKIDSGDDAESVSIPSVLLLDKSKTVFPEIVTAKELKSSTVVPLEATQLLVSEDTDKSKITIAEEQPHKVIGSFDHDELLSLSSDEKILKPEINDVVVLNEQFVMHTLRDTDKFSPSSITNSFIDDKLTTESLRLETEEKYYTLGTKMTSTIKEDLRGSNTEDLIDFTTNKDLPSTTGDTDNLLKDKDSKHKTTNVPLPSTLLMETSESGDVVFDLKIQSDDKHTIQPEDEYNVHISEEHVLVQDRLPHPEPLNLISIPKEHTNQFFTTEKHADSETDTVTLTSTPKSFHIDLSVTESTPNSNDLSTHTDVPNKDTNTKIEEHDSNVMKIESKQPIHFQEQASTTQISTTYTKFEEKKIGELDSVDKDDLKTLETENQQSLVTDHTLVEEKLFSDSDMVSVEISFPSTSVKNIQSTSIPERFDLIEDKHYAEVDEIITVIAHEDVTVSQSSDSFSEKSTEAQETNPSFSPNFTDQSKPPQDITVEETEIYPSSDIPYSTKEHERNASLENIFFNTESNNVFKKEELDQQTFGSKTGINNEIILNVGPSSFTKLDVGNNLNASDVYVLQINKNVSESIEIKTPADSYEENDKKYELENSENLFDLSISPFHSGEEHAATSTEFNPFESESTSEEKSPTLETVDDTQFTEKQEIDSYKSVASSTEKETVTEVGQITTQKASNEVFSLKELETEKIETTTIDVTKTSLSDGTSIPNIQGHNDGSKLSNVENSFSIPIKQTGSQGSEALDEITVIKVPADVFPAGESIIQPENLLISEVSLNDTNHSEFLSHENTVAESLHSTTTTSEIVTSESLSSLSEENKDILNEQQFTKTATYIIYNSTYSLPEESPQHPSQTEKSIEENTNAEGAKYFEGIVTFSSDFPIISSSITENINGQSAVTSHAVGLKKSQTDFYDYKPETSSLKFENLLTEDGSFDYESNYSSNIAAMHLNSSNLIIEQFTIKDSDESDQESFAPFTTKSDSFFSEKSSQGKDNLDSTQVTGENIYSSKEESLLSSPTAFEASNEVSQKEQDGVQKTEYMSSTLISITMTSHFTESETDGLNNMAEEKVSTENQKEEPLQHTQTVTEIQSENDKKTEVFMKPENILLKGYSTVVENDSTETSTSEFYTSSKPHIITDFQEPSEINAISQVTQLSMNENSDIGSEVKVTELYLPKEHSFATQQYLSEELSSTTKTLPSVDIATERLTTDQSSNNITQESFSFPQTDHQEKGEEQQTDAAVTEQISIVSEEEKSHYESENLQISLSTISVHSTENTNDLTENITAETVTERPYSTSSIKQYPTSDYPTSFSEPISNITEKYVSFTEQNSNEISETQKYVGLNDQKDLHSISVHEIKDLSEESTNIIKESIDQEQENAISTAYKNESHKLFEEPKRGEISFENTEKIVDVSGGSKVFEGTNEQPILSLNEISEIMKSSSSEDESTAHLSSTTIMVTDFASTRDINESSRNTEDELLLKDSLSPSSIQEDDSHNKMYLSSTQVTTEGYPQNSDIIQLEDSSSTLFDMLTTLQSLSTLKGTQTTLRLSSPTTTSPDVHTTSELSPTTLGTQPEIPEMPHDGLCYYNGDVFHSAEQVPRADPCEFCFCFRGDILCLQQTCPPPIHGCYATPIRGFCCPRFHCPVQEKHFNLSIPLDTPPRSRLSYMLQKTPSATGCEIEGVIYRIHQLVRPSSGPCMQCRCEHGGMMKCDPRDCQPQAPLLLRLNRDFFKKK